MPIRINLKEIFPSDPQEINVDKLNFNFNKLLELGVGSPGPIGLTGPQGPAGPTGLTGPQGDRGATWWVDSGDPNTLTFTGLIDGDLYLDQSSTAFEVYQYSELTSSWTSIVSIAAVVNAYLSTVAPSPFELYTGTPNDQFIVFKNREDLINIDNVRGAANGSTNNILFLNNFDETTITFPLGITLQDSYNSLLGIFVAHNDATPSNDADTGRYHFEYGSLYTPDGGTTSLLSELRHNLKGRFYKKYISSAELSLTNTWINTAEFSLSVPPATPFNTIDQNGIFEFVTPKYNNEASTIQDSLSIRMGAWEAQVEQGSEFTYILADGVSMSLPNSGTPLVTNIGIAQNYQSGYPEIDTKNFFMLDSNSNIDGILLNKDTYIVGDLQVFGKTTTDTFRLTDGSGIAGQWLRSSDALGNAEWSDNLISKTWAQLNTLKSGNDLIPGAYYEITDSIYQNNDIANNEKCSIYIQALSTNKLSSHAIRKMRIIKDSIYSAEEIWKPGLSISFDGIVIWGGRVWIANVTHTSATSDITNNAKLGTNYDIQDIDDDDYYEDKVFKVIYDFYQDWVVTQYDDRGNVFTTEINKNYYASDTYSGYGNNKGFPTMTLSRGRSYTNPIDFCDWGNPQIYNNKLDFIVNNANGSLTNISIYNNNKGWIVNNYNDGNINDNSCISIRRNGNIGVAPSQASISFNSCEEIYLNFNSGRIINNSNKGDIYQNDNPGAIEFNSNDGSIYAHPDTSRIGDIKYNSNKGSIYNNTGPVGGTAPGNCDIEYNSNLGAIYNNTKIITSIYRNNNSGEISFNSLLNTIEHNSNTGDILNNYKNPTLNIDDLVFTPCGIYNNTNGGDIVNNKLKDINEGYGILYNSNRRPINGNGGLNYTVGDISFNSNTGQIQNNDCTDPAGWFYITRNSNNGGIYSNNVEKSISYNSNNGDIFDNDLQLGTPNGVIDNNSNNGDIKFNDCISIKYNKNAGDIELCNINIDVVQYNINLGFIDGSSGTGNIEYLGLDASQVLSFPHDYP